MAKKINQTIGFVGCGNMGSAIIKALLAKKVVKPRQVFIFDANSKKLREVAKTYGVRKAGNNKEVVRESKIIILAFKPQDLPSIGAEIAKEFKRGQILISLLAGTPVRKLKRLFSSHVSIVRTMPNLGAKVSEGMTAITGNEKKALNLAELIFSSCGAVVRLPEKYFDLITAVSGSGPAYFFLLMELLQKIGEKAGLSTGISRLLAVQTAVGAGVLAQRSGLEPRALREAVTSKKGTTDAALKYLFRKRFTKIFTEAVNRARLRAHELSRG
ncbi:MAG: pyrroline-5-carboxylate reductase [Omnitrophica bacterium RIFCSPLOWO2_12_FULL_44_17]|uniref:Pyrroline-5-carboxylate reductase n=1 Tax=Candidatus Danuiimicrobium aquiferis TaxID=1801832 RepID=A0A1G1KRU6_9BACT|nr:MAG: pyrroline-5-carboxylate reductase [Omnitrophica bacterium RIFCSPHIGHO2_02_FULL_45_28]OGW95643.1 MAG: pyrroline-5-carboxylate reductase [Omnitrophica bacterium RIFCSPLOWO2_12_FULL_44_17]OGX04764.1 MAG: pyrroline-5-carboxylate reductase [Omnitrophica bacterium RIFCSPLOWO2_02_FULL_44_11]